METIDKKNNSGQVKLFIKENIVWLLGLAFTIANLYIASLISPIKQDIRALAARVDNVEANNKKLSDMEIRSKLNSQNIVIIREDIGEIKQSLIRVEGRLNNE